MIDFGIAKALSMELTSRTLFTGLGQMIGTPQYMSPEQAETNALNVDTRSGVYSLGVVLYELLTGRTPIDSKCLREAGPPSASYRLRKFTRRNRRSLVTAAIITAGVLSTAGVWMKSGWDSRQRASQLSQQVLAFVTEAERLMQENERVDFDNDEPFRRALELSERAKAILGRQKPDPTVVAKLDGLLTAVGQERSALLMESSEDWETSQCYLSLRNPNQPPL